MTDTEGPTESVNISWEDILNFSVNKSDQFEKKVKYLVDTYKCFTESDKAPPSKWLKKRIGGPPVEHKPIERAERPRIGTKELSIEHITRKEFLSLMNKLTYNNKNVIIKSIKNILREDYSKLYIEIIWDLMQRAPEFRLVYFEVLKLFDTHVLMSKWKIIWDNYYVNRSWIPRDDILPENEDYDEFCDFVKWKKRAVASIQIWILLYQREIISTYTIDSLIREIVDDCNTELSKHVSDANVVTAALKKIDALLDQIIILVNFTKTENDDHFIELVKKWLPHAENIKPSSRFKLYDINEVLQGKMKSVYKVKKGL
jgi:hypothetical protein